MKVVRSFLAILLVAASANFAPASATSYSTDQSDLWWNQSESGWGIQFVHRGNLIFATMFVYDPFDPMQVGSRIVGTMTWAATSTSSGTLTYTVDGVSVTKLLTRQTLV